MSDTMNRNKFKVIVSGGGTGGHIFPALSIASELRDRCGAEILFVGAEGRMEMEKVPAAGFRIEGLPVAGFNRKNILKNIKVLRLLFKSMRMARNIIRDFRPDVVVGVGGYASGPTLKAAQKAGIPTLIQEQNSYAGVTNKLLAKKARRICVAYKGMERFFPADRIILTGNPVRKEILDSQLTAEQARSKFGLAPDIPVLLVVGGSLGARTLNDTLAKDIERLVDNGVQVIWQTGKYYGDKARKAAKGLKGVVVTEFISDMAAAYRAASLLVSRAGAGSISEIELLAKPAILVPSPNVAEDHQTKNASALVAENAAVMIPDSECVATLADTALRLLGDKKRLAEMSANVRSLALEESDRRIVGEILALVK